MTTGPGATSQETDPAEGGRVAAGPQDVDVLAGWDPAGPPPVLDGSGPFPTDTVTAVAGMVIGMGLGLAVGGRHPLVRAELGAIAGLAVAVASRRMWRLPG
jgi:hypothetical protein